MYIVPRHSAPREGRASHEVPEPDHGRGRKGKGTNSSLARTEASTEGKQGRNVHRVATVGEPRPSDENNSAVHFATIPLLRNGTLRKRCILRLKGKCNAHASERSQARAHSAGGGRASALLVV